MDVMTAWLSAHGTSSPSRPSMNNLLARDDLDRPGLVGSGRVWMTTNFGQGFAGSPIKRIGRNRFVRNVLIAIGNSGDRTLLPAAETLRHDPDPVVAEAAEWAADQLANRIMLPTFLMNFQRPRVDNLSGQPGRRAHQRRRILDRLRRQRCPQAVRPGLPGHPSPAARSAPLFRHVAAPE